MTFQRPCIDCGALTSMGNRCKAHRAEMLAKYSRSKGASPYADTAWRKLSAQLRRKRGWCEMCGTTADLTVDHLDPISRGGVLLAPEHRLAVLCRRCHGRRTKHK